MEVAQGVAGTMVVRAEPETPAVARGVAGTMVVRAEPETPAVARGVAGTMVVRAEPETPAVARGVAGTVAVQAASGKEVERVAVAREAVGIPALVAVVLPERLAEQKWDRVTQ
jgi:ribosomal protein S11